MKNVLKNVWFRSIASLLLIALIAGGLLSVLRDVLYVSAEERTARAIKKIYGSDKQYSVEFDDENSPIDYGYGKINKVYLIDGGADILFQTTGYHGYKEGTITLWVKVSVSENNVYSIDKVLLQDYDKQTLMSKLGEDYYNKFRITDVTSLYRSGKLFSATDKNLEYNVVSGATFSSTAGDNAVNCVLKYLSEKEPA